MIIDALRRSLDGTHLYVRVDRQRIIARNVSSGEEFSCRPRAGVDTERSLRSIGEPVAPDAAQIVEPFNHPRVLIDDYDIAEQLIQFVIRKMTQSQTFSVSPCVVMHADMPLEGGLSTIEARALYEMAIHAGARRAIVHEGDVLSDDEVVALCKGIDSL